MALFSHTVVLPQLPLCTSVRSLCLCGEYPLEKFHQRVTEAAQRCTEKTKAVEVVTSMSLRTNDDLSRNCEARGNGISGFGVKATGKTGLLAADANQELARFDNASPIAIN